VEGKGQGCLASSRQYGNALLGVRHQEEVGLGVYVTALCSPLEFRA